MCARGRGKISDIKYGGTGEGFGDTLKRWQEQENALGDQAKAERDLGAAEAENTRVRGGNTKARGDATSVIQSNVEALNLSTSALQRETGMLTANTAAWRESAIARGTARAKTSEGSLAGSAATGEASGATSVGLSDSYRRIDQKLAQAQAAAAADAREQIERSGQLTLKPNAPLPAQARLFAASETGRYTRLTDALPAYQPLLGPGSPRVGPSTPIDQPLRRAPGTAFAGTAGELSEEPLVKYSDAAKQAILANASLESSFAGVPEELAKANAAFQLAAAESASASQSITRHGALSTEFIQSFVRGETTLNEFGNALSATIGKFAGWAVAGGLVYGAFEALKRVTDGAKETASGIDQLERALPGRVNKRQAEEGFRNASQAINVPIRTAADAQFYAARAGFGNQAESQKAGEIALEAHKLDEVPIQDATRGLGALHIAFGLNADQINRVFHELNTGQLDFNARLSQTLPQLGRAASAVASAGGNVQEFVAQLVATIGVTGGGGGQGGGTPATLFIREPSNVQKPNSAAVLTREGFNPEDALKDITGFNRKLGERVRNLPASAFRPGESADEAKARVTREFAQAIGGGSAVGNRYGIGLINAASSGRLGEIEKANRETPSGGRAEDLGKKLSQLDEQLSKIGVTFEALGSEIGKSGVTAAAEGFLSVLELLSSGFETAAKPLISIGQAIGEIPGPLQTALVALAGAAGINRFARSDKSLGFSRAAGEAGVGFLDSPTNAAFRAARRTADTTVQGQKNIVERAAAQNQAAAEAYEDSVVAKSRYIGSPADQRRQQLYAKDKLSPESIAAGKEAEQYDANIRSAGAKKALTEERLESVHGRLLFSEEQAALLANKDLEGRKLNLSRQQRLQAFSASNGVIAPGGVSSNEPLLAGERPVGAAYNVRSGRAAAEADAAQRESGLIIPGGATLREEEKAAAIQYEAASAQVTKALEEGGIEIKSGFAIANEQLKAALADLALAIKLGTESVAESGSLSAAGAAARSGAGGLVSSGGSFAGAAVSSVTQNLLKGFFTAYIGSAIAEIVGGALPGNAGKVVGNLGKDAAIGAGLGTIIPIIGPAAGAAGGAAFGAGQDIGRALFGGYSREEEEQILKRRQESNKTTRERLETPASQLGIKSGSEPAIESLFTHENVAHKEAAARAERIQDAAAAFSQELETAFKDESEGAKKALKYIETSIQNSEAQLKLYGTKTPHGKEAVAGLAKDYEDELKELTEHPSRTAQTLAAIEKTAAARTTQAKSTFSEQLKEAITPEQVRKALAEAQQPAVSARDAHAAHVAELNEKLEVERANEARLQKQLTSEEAGGKVNSQTQVDAARKRLKSAVEAGNPQEATKIEQEIRQLEKEAGTVPAVKINVTRTNLKKTQESIESIVRGLRSFKEAQPGLEKLFKELSTETGGEAYKAILSLQEKPEARALAEAGPDAGRQSKVERGYRQKGERETRKLPLTANERTDQREENITARVKEEQKAQQEQVQEAERGTARELAALPVGAPTSAAATIKARGAAAKLAIVKRNQNNAFTNAQLEEAETSLAEADKARGEAVESEAEAILTAEGSLEQAKYNGQPVKQAQEAERNARQKLAAAKTKPARISAQADLVNARNAREKAEQEEVGEKAKLKESTELNPLEQDSTKIKQLRTELSKAKNPKEKRTLQGELNTELQKYASDKVSEVTDEARSLDQLQIINGPEAAERLRKVLTENKGKLSKAAERSLKQEIYAYENEGNAGNTDFNVGNIKLPTLYDAKTAAAFGTHPAYAIARKPNLPGVVGQHAQPVSPAPKVELHQSNVIEIKVSGHEDPAKVAEKVSTVLHKELHTNTRAQLRSAGLRS